MIARFDEIKTQLKELAEAINSFKSEAVQLRIVELILSAEAHAEDRGDAEETGQPRPRKKAAKRKSSSPPPSEDGGEGPGTPGSRRARNSTGRPGPGEMIDRLIAEGYFKSGKTAGQIIEHCRDKHAAPYKTSDMSPTLVRALRSKKLERSKNEEGQFEYSRPKSGS